MSDAVATPASSRDADQQEAAFGVASDLPSTESVASECEATHENEGRNFFWLAIHQLLLRVGWVFKTESIVMPFFMDAIGGGPVLRGSLMVFNRLGFSVPPALFARTLKLMPQKRLAVGLSTGAMAIPFAVLSVLWASGLWRDATGAAAWWMPYFFLLAYGIFFALTGINQLAAHSIGGKLIRPERRGRLFSAGVLVGSPVAILCAWMLMPRWLSLPDGGFTWMFAAPAVCFLLASLTQLAIRERSDTYEEEPSPAWRRLWEATHLAFAPGPCRRVAITALLFSVTFTLFPHYQALARQTAEAAPGTVFDLRSLMIWTVTQHAAVAVLSLFTGPLADRLGNRVAVQLCVFGSAIAPLTAVVMSTLPTAITTQWFWIVFFPMGFTPVAIKMLMNYTLELVPQEEHPRYVSALGMCLALPVMVGSPLVGALIGWIGCVPVFAMGSAVLLIAGGQTLFLSEPRHAA